MEFQQDPGEEVVALVDRLKEKAETIGLYLGDAMVATPHTDLAEELGITKTVHEAIADGAHFVIVAQFAIGQVAWRKRTLDPDQDEIDRKVQAMLPDPADDIRRRLEEGGPLFADGDGDE